MNITNYQLSAVTGWGFFFVWIRFLERGNCMNPTTIKIIADAVVAIITLACNKNNKNE